MAIDLRLLVSASAMLLLAHPDASASASSLSGGNPNAYRVTDLSSVSIQYDWNKYPVISADRSNTYVYYSWQFDPGGGYVYQDAQGHVSEQIPVASNKYGSISYEVIRYSGISVGSPDFGVFYPGPNQLPWYMDNSGIPVKDFNIHGQAVGIIFNDYAAVSNMGDPVLDDNIPAELGIHLTLAYSIDDMGRILAKGTIHGETHDFLLTPAGLPVPAPEPSTIAFVAVGMTALGLRSAARRRERRKLIASLPAQPGM